MDDFASPLLGGLGFAILIFLPGAWITFGLPLSTLQFWAKLLTGVMLAPLVVVLQFYGLRVLGIPFESTAIFLIAINLPPLYLIYRQRDRLSLPQPSIWSGMAVIPIVHLASFSQALLDPVSRLFSGHGWMHADIIYSIAEGALVPEDTLLAGVRLAYPWIGHVYQAVLSFLLGSPPIVNYIWTNLGWLLLISGFTVGIVAELGGNWLTRISSVIWLAFGLNFLGFPLHLGDYRYTPLELKFLFFNQMPFALGAFIALVYLTIRRWPEAVDKSMITVVCLLMTVLGLIYPILFPAVCAVVGARALVIWSQRQTIGSRAVSREVLRLGLGLLVSGAITLAYLAFAFEDNVPQAILFTSDAVFLVRKIVDSFVAAFPFLVGLAFLLPTYWSNRRGPVRVLLLGAVASFVLYIALHLSAHWGNEYKFVMTAAICLTPFAALALEPVMKRLGGKAVPAVGVITLIIALPFAYKFLRGDFTSAPDDFPSLDVSEFRMRLEETEPMAALLEATYHDTPADSILVLDRAELSFPTLTHRSLYVPFLPNEVLAGVNMANDDLLMNIRGYDMRLVEARRENIRGLFDPDNELQRIQSLGHIMALGRPLVMFLDEQRHTNLLRWLNAEDKGRPLFADDGLILWLIEPKGG